MLKNNGESICTSIAKNLLNQRDPRASMATHATGSVEEHLSRNRDWSVALGDLG